MAKKPGFRMELKCVVYKDDDLWIAHCLELDIVAEGTDPREAVKNCIDLCEFQLKSAMEDGMGLDSILHAAPAKYWEMFFSISEKRIRQHPSKFLEQFEARELALS